MTEDDFLKRWSRRKREVAEAEKPAPTEAETRGQAPLPDHAASGEPEKKADAEFDPASLPPIESITAVSDITAFLRAGVPAELTRAALRRVWTADPAIRDFVGLAENAWDFTDPNAMPGFGPLESTDEVRRMIAQIVDQIGEAARPQVAEARAPGMEVSKNSNASNVVGAAGHEDGALSDVGSEPDRTAEGAAENLGNQVLLHSNKDDDAVQRDVTEDPKKTKQSSHRIHGAALPR
jgi:Protein of unknown function (DUF3306)